MSDLMRQSPGAGDGMLETRRQAVMDSLTEAFAQGLLDMDTYELRATQANKAMYAADLEELLVDLPPVLRHNSTIKVQTNRQPAGLPAFSVANHLAGLPRMNTACIMGEKNFAGNWLQSDKVSAFTLMGSTKLDLTATPLPPGPTAIELYTLMGETIITVPRGLPVRFNVTSIMADTKVDRGVEQQLPGAASWLEVHGMVVMGEVRVRAS